MMQLRDEEKGMETGRIWPNVSSSVTPKKEDQRLDMDVSH
jgi:hypothetical protein